MKKSNLRIIVVVALFITMLGTSSIAMATTVSFRDSRQPPPVSIQINSSSSANHVGPGKANNKSPVSIVQAAHNSYHHLSPILVIDGKCGPATEPGIIRLQAAIGAKTDGLFGPDSWVKLGSVRGAAVYPGGLPFLWN